jgi:ribokinase
VGGTIVVVGSINVDLVVAANRLPAPGETVLGGTFSQHHGGKGANQAVAAARAGASVVMIGAVGSDAYGEAALAALAQEGIDVTRVRRVTEPTGVAIVAVGPRGENQIVVAPGANASVTPEDVADLRGDVLLASLEVPMPTVVAAMRTADERRMTRVLNPAPAHALPADLLSLSPIITPNEHELIVAIGNDEPAAALGELVDHTQAPVIVTQGPAGALLADGIRRERFPGFAPPGEIDATGAGDTFAGVLGAWLGEGADLDVAIEAANAAAAISVSVIGAREGMPTREAIAEFLRTAPSPHITTPES